MGIFNPFEGTKEYETLLSDVRHGKGPVAVTGAVDPAKTQLLSAVSMDDVKGASGTGWKLFVVKDEASGKRFVRDLHGFGEAAWFYPAKDFLFYQADTQGTLLTRQRVEVLRHILEDQGGVIVTTIDALMDKVLGRETFTEAVLTIRPGMVIELEALNLKLSKLGFERASEVSAMGEYAVRGGLVDIFPFNVENPVRVEFWDTEVDNLRTFDVASQRSQETLESIDIYPATDKARNSQEENREVSLLDYFDEKTILFLDEPDRLKERGKAVEDEFRESFDRRTEEAARKKAAGVGISEEEAGKDPDKLIYSADQVMERLDTGRTVAFSTLGNNLSCIDVKKLVHFETTEVTPYKCGFELLIKDLKAWQKEKYRIILLSPSRTRASRLAQNLREYDIRAYCPDENQKASEEDKGAVQVLYGFLNSGYQVPAEKFVVLTEGDMFGNQNEVKRKRKQKKLDGQKIAKLEELTPGDYVVHEDHGIGIYRGIERITTEGVEKDYIKIEYGDGGNLYLPATRLEGIQKYAGKEAKAPKLNKLNGTDWQKTRSRVQHAVKEIARDLVRIYAARQKESGFKFSTDTVWQKEFEEMFPYEETADQTLAIEATKDDMESHKIMDRLICGDVGYGKTEIALRAAFKAVQDSKQVAYLVPTTILAQQIYNTFQERMKNFPVKVDLLCRFRTPQQMKKTVHDLENGQVDIVVGTHRLLSKDVHFKDLGLLVVDEEQRFGVTHKERIKDLKKNVDVLTLTATPIPRTLHMSLVGIRDMSVLEEPPMDRVPIQTYVMEYNDELVREAISRELARQGQVYYVHNRVGSIAEIAAHVQKLCPDARVAYAHGQMSENQLEDIMLQFVNGEIDVLVSTTIIETGLDIPNANTLIIQDADRMGLSQLYQLRGRVGRSNRTAYAFLMYRRGKMLSEESEKRLKAIKEFTQLGSGIKIAMRDLEIRGAGNVLGAEQHGHMEAVGYDLYCKLLNTAVQEEKGEAVEGPSFDTQVECEIDAFIPDSYIQDESEKLDIYKRISAITNDEDYMDMQDELTDRFGELPKPCENLLGIAHLRAIAHKAYVTEVNITRGSFRVMFYPQAEINVTELPKLVREAQGQLRFSSGAKPMLVYRQSAHAKPEQLPDTMKTCEAVLRRLILG